MRTTRVLAGAVSPAAAATSGLAGPAVAADICDVSVAVLARLGPDDAAPCTADATPEASITEPDSGPGPRQDGLVNVNISDLDAQIPVAVAANVCDPGVAVLAELGTGAAAACDAAANPGGTVTVLP